MMTEIVYTEKFGMFDKLKIWKHDVQPKGIADILIRKGYARYVNEPVIKQEVIISEHEKVVKVPEKVVELHEKVVEAPKKVAFETPKKRKGNPNFGKNKVK